MDDQNKEALALLAKIGVEAAYNKNNEENLGILTREVTRINQQINSCQDDHVLINTLNTCYLVKCVLLEYFRIIQGNIINDLLAFDLEVNDILSR